MARTVDYVTPAVLRRARGTSTARSVAARLLIYLVLLAGAVWFVLPLMWMATSSLKTKADIFQYPPVLFPWPFHLENYADLFAVWPFWAYLRNTLTITVPSVFGQVLSSSLAAYGFARMRWPGRNVVFVVVLATMMLPFQVTMIPLYIIFRQLGWIGTFAPLIVPNFFGSAFDIFLLRQFFLGIPAELTDAARIDGCGHPRIYWRIILPLAKPALATVALFEFLYNWNDFLGPLIYLQDNSQYTLSLALQNFQSLHQPQPQLLMTAATIMVVPIIVVFFLAQRTFIQGITLTGLKG
jgi:ABC-type glycerol-3-phosphate transport system permease component